MSKNNKKKKQENNNANTNTNGLKLIKATKTLISQEISQGDIFENVRYIGCNRENENSYEVTEYSFSHAIIISQGCDVLAASNLVEPVLLESYKNCEDIEDVKEITSLSKYMPSILLCPIYETYEAMKYEHLTNVCEKIFSGKIASSSNLYDPADTTVSKRDLHYRYQQFNVIRADADIKNINPDDRLLWDSVIDFKHYFTVPIDYLLNNRQNRLCRVDHIYSQQITVKFASFLTRIAIQ